MEFVIRAMKKDDWEAVAGIYKEGIDTKIATFQADVPSYENWDKSHTPHGRFVAEENGNIIGWTAMSPYSNRCVYAGVAEVSIYVKADQRRKRVGEKLLMELIKESEQEGIWTLQAGILEINSASIALHRKVGFRMVGFRDKIAKDLNGVWQNTVLMERRSTSIQ